MMRHRVRCVGRLAVNWVVTRLLGSAPAAGVFIALCGPGWRDARADALPGGTLDPSVVPKYVSPLVIPPAMPRSGKLKARGGKNTDYYEIAVREFAQQILPPETTSGDVLPPTTVWSYGSVVAPGTVPEGGSFFYPALTIEAKYERPVRVKWINDLKNPVTGTHLPHLLPVDQTLHWANPPGGIAGRDRRGVDPALYTGPVPIVTHVHGAHTTDDSDGYTEAWYLPDATDIPDTYATTGTWYASFKAKAEAAQGQAWDPGTAVFEYPNDQRATTLWYHDHTLGMTRLNVYAGPAGFYLLRGGPDDEVLDSATGLPATLPGPAPAHGDPPGITYYEIPLAIQDRSFNADGSLYYPDNRAFFEGLDPSELQIPFIPESACDEDSDGTPDPSDVSPIWNPEFFGNMMVVNGRTWPYLEVEQRRYRLRLLNGCNSRFLILKFDNELPIWQIGAEGGFLETPVERAQILMSPAERADVVVDFSGVDAGSSVTLLNLGPDEPFGGGTPGVDFDPADSETTGQVVQFRVADTKGRDPTTPPERLELPDIEPLEPDPLLPPRRLSLNEAESHTVRVITDDDGNVVFSCDDPDAEIFGPTEALLGTVDAGGSGTPLGWMDPITENPSLGSTEIWEIHNFTEDAHPIHVHLVMFQVVDRTPLGEEIGGLSSRGPEPTELGWKDTVIAYPGEVTRIRARFDLEGLYVWHCHIVEHEDNEMMRPYAVGAIPEPQEAGGGAQLASDSSRVDFELIREGAFLRGDVDGDGQLMVTDPMLLLGHLFSGGKLPPCRDAADADDNGDLEVGDAIRTLGFLFLGEAPPAIPGPGWTGFDPTDDDLGCEGSKAL